MQNNLNVHCFRNGDQITEAKSNEEWLNAGVKHKPAWCYYNNNALLGFEFGKLYNWYAVNDSRNLAPEGWILPSNFDYLNLVNSVGGNYKEQMMKYGGSQNEENASNKSVFFALPAGIRSHNGIFSNLGIGGYFWTTSEQDSDFAYALELGKNAGNWASLDVFGTNKIVGMSIRCFSYGLSLKI